MAEVADLTLLDDNNDAAPPDGAPEGIAPGTLNNIVRALMGKLRRWFDDPEYLDLMRDAQGVKFSLTRDSDTVLRVVSGAVDMTTPYFPVGRRVKVVGDTTVFGRVTASSFPNPDTLVTIDGDGTAVLPTNPTTIFVNIMASLDSDRFFSVVNPIEVGEFL